MRLSLLFSAGEEEDSGRHIYPLLATVTYVTACGGPTIILNKAGTQDSSDSIEGAVHEV